MSGHQLLQSDMHIMPKHKPAYIMNRGQMGMTRREEEEE
jgi:hypothetical protein